MNELDGYIATSSEEAGAENKSPPQRKLQIILPQATSFLEFRKKKTTMI